jgi:hypothetical protein
MGKEQALVDLPGAATSADQLVGIMRQWVLLLDALIDLKSEGQIIGGGVPAGERALVLIFDAESDEGLDTILRRLSLWGWQSGK